MNSAWRDSCWKRRRPACRWPSGHSNGLETFRLCRLVQAPVKADEQNRQTELSSELQARGELQGIAGAQGMTLQEGRASPAQGGSQLDHEKGEKVPAQGAERPVTILRRDIAFAATACQGRRDFSVAISRRRRQVTR